MEHATANEQFIEFGDPDGMFVIDIDRVTKILYSFERSVLIGQLSDKKEIVDPAASWFDDLFMPDIYAYETDWGKVKAQGKAKASVSLKTLCLGSLSYKSHGHSVAVPIYNQLVHLNAMTKTNMARYQQKLNDVSRESMRAVEHNVAGWDQAIAATKFVRDTSADILIIGGTILPPAKAAGAALKVVGKYQDTGSIGQAAFEGVTTVVFMSIPDPGGAKGKVALLLAKSVTDGAKVYLEKGDIEKAIAAGVISGVTDGVIGKVLETEAAKKVFLKAALPVRSTLITNNMALKHTFNKSLPSMYLRTSRSALDLSKKAVGYAPEQAVKKTLEWAQAHVLDNEEGPAKRQSSLRAPILSNVDKVDVGIYAIES